MSYQALYRKYRPKNLNEVYGQPVAVNILKNAILNKKIGHAYLFTGSRGCGKTSVAKIVARMINCDNLSDGIPCEQCSYCIENKKNNCVDIIEIDAASNNGVDEIRELKSKINLVPASMKYKVYIIDEVHMLSIGAFNALLKTLEEPPEHAIFILATTEYDKVPTTIVSRCQTIEFKKINKNDMFLRLKNISNEENIKISDDALNEIINCSDGCLRDAIGLLDMASSYNPNEISDQDIYIINGVISNEEIEYLSSQLVNKNLNVCLNLINDYDASGKDLIKIIEKVVMNLKNKMITTNNINICDIVKKLCDTIEKMKNSSLKKIYIDTTLFEICSSSKTDFIEDSNDKNINANNKIYENKDKKNNIKKIDCDLFNEKKENTKNVDTNMIKKIRVNNTFVAANKNSLLDVKKRWNQLNNFTFDRSFGALVCDLLDAVPVAASNEYIILTYDYDSFVNRGNTLLEKYEKTLLTTINLKVKIVFVSCSEWLMFKNEYINNLKKGKKYSYIYDNKSESELALHEKNNDISLKDVKQSDIIELATDLFAKNKIEIKESR